MKTKGARTYMSADALVRASQPSQMVLNEVLDEIYRTGHVWDQQGNRFPAFPTSIHRQEGEVLYRIVSDLPPSRTLEIGLAYGLSSLFICQAHAEHGARDDRDSCRHTAIDPFQQSYWKDIGLLNLERAGYRDMVRFFEEPSHMVLPRLLQAEESYDVVFIDGAHLFDYVLLDFYYTDRLVRSGGLVILHDVKMPSVRKLLAFILRNLGTYRLESRYFLRAVPPWKRFTSTLRALLQSPTEIHTWSLPWSQGFADLFSRNFCVLRKVNEDSRPWHHYRAF